MQAVSRGVAARRILALQASAAASIQAVSRANFCRQRFAAMKLAAVAVQAAARRAHAIQTLQWSRWAARYIQAVARGVAERRLADQWTLAAMRIQASWRSLLAQAALAESIEAATVIQTAGRTFVARCLRERSQRAALLIQAVARGRIERRLCDAWTLAAIAIQSAQRMAVCRRLIASSVRATVQVQAGARGLVARRVLRRCALACTRLQAAARRRASLVAFAELKRRHFAAIAIQSAGRVALAIKQSHAIRKVMHLAALAKLHQCARLVQTRARFLTYRNCRRAAAAVIARRALTAITLRRRVRFVRVVVSLQAMLRARRTRSRVYRRHPELRNIAARAAEAYRKMLADPSLCLPARTKVALDILLTTKNLGQLLSALSSLEMFTLISPRVAAAMVEVGTVPVMLQLLQLCNRSLPHQKAVGHVLRILANIGRTPSLRDRVWEQREVVPTIVELAQNYREHEQLLRESLVVMQQLLVTGPREWRAHVFQKMPEFVKRLDSILALAKRKADKMAKEQRPPNAPSRRDAKKDTVKRAADPGPDNVTRLSQLVAALKGSAAA